MANVTYDARAIVVDGKRTLTLGGAIHYPRSTPAMWPDLMKRSRAAGLNTIETYVFWNLHERARGVLDFSDRLDLPRFCRVAQEHGLNVILRIGPYICAETNYGGLPPWLREVSGMRMRTFNGPFMREMERWVRCLCAVLQPQFAPQGGPIVLAQMENEYNNIAKYYGEQGQKYLQWCVDMADGLKLGIPLVMCAGGAPGSIETINAFYGHEQLEAHFQNHPDQPALWTEAYPGWYDTWGYPHHTRSTADMAYAAARFFAGGGTGINYYMWHGGTNFGRETMYLQTASYDFDAPLDEYGLETTKSCRLARVHALLQEHVGLLLGQDAPTARRLGEKLTAFTYGAGAGALTFLCNDDPAQAGAVTWDGVGVSVAPRAVVALKGGKVLLDTAATASASRVRRRMGVVAKGLGRWEVWREPLPGARGDDAVTAARPVEELSLTHDASDYCWYTTELKVRPGDPPVGELELRGVGDLVYVFVDGVPRALTLTPLVENRTLARNKGFTQRFSVPLKPGTRQLQLLCCALGLIKGDWMLGFRNMVEERKGLWGEVRWNGRPLRGAWTMLPGLVGERAAVFGGGGSFLPWESGATGVGKALTWWRTPLKAPGGSEPLALDMVGMGKGLIWLNGRCLGRYWLVEASDPNPISPRELGGKKDAAAPTQRFYHVPREWLQASNELVLFEEEGGDPRNVRLCLRR